MKTYLSVPLSLLPKEEGRRRRDNGFRITSLNGSRMASKSAQGTSLCEGRRIEGKTGFE